jgi:hypothetical protein
VHPLAAAGALALEERDHHAVRGHEARREVRDGNPALSGPWPGKPLTVMNPESPWAIWSKPARSAYGPVCPNPEMLTYTSRGFIAESVS